MVTNFKRHPYELNVIIKTMPQYELSKGFVNMSTG